MTYAYWLVGISLLFVVVERIRPARRQGLVRPQFLNDLFYLGFNGYLWALLTGALTGAVALAVRGWLGSVLPFAEEGSALGALPFAGQFAIYLVVSDFLQWCVHNLLHRVPFLWKFHKVHHSVHVMDWAANFRFHWMELVVYRSFLYVPLALLGGDAAPLFAVAVFATFWGHFNHANVGVGIGPLAWLFNSPRMHLWHHDASDEGGVSKNFGIVLSLWDWIFGTAHWPRDRAPERIGYPGDEEMPAGILPQLGFPLTRVR